MPVRTRIDPIDRDIALMIGADLSPAAQSKALADFARSALTDAEAIDNAALGYTPTHDTFVDGSAATDAGLDRVRPDGTIVFRFKLLEDVFEFVDNILILSSPVKTGRYQRSHLFFADDIEADPLNPPPAREYVFLNAQPYSRKIERGLSSQAPDGVYQSAAAVASQRFGNVAKIRFAYRSLPGGAIGAWAREAKVRPRRRNLTGAKLQDWLTQQPAIVITA